MKTAYLSLGSNIGDKFENLEKAIDIIKSNQGIKDIKVSSFYETEPVGYLEQDVFINIVIEVKTSLSPYELLELCMNVEKELKRKRIIRWGPRSIDVDILLYEDFTNNEEKLTVPHPRMHERAFVIVPLYELNKNLKINDKNIENIYNLVEKDGIKKLNYNLGKEE